MHLHVVLNDPMPMEGYGRYACALACFSSVPTTGIPYDNTRVFEAGAHPFFVHQTYVAYNFFRVEQAQHLISCVQNGSYVQRNPHFSGDDVAWIIEGYKVSRRVSRGMKGLPL